MSLVINCLAVKVIDNLKQEVYIYIVLQYYVKNREINNKIQRNIFENLKKIKVR